MKTVNILSRDDLFAEMLCIELREAGYNANVGRTSLPDLIIIDLASMDAVQGFSALTFSRDKHADLHRPFDIGELLELVKSRIDTNNGSDISDITDIYVSKKECYSVYKNERIEFSELEHSLLLLLYECRGRALSTLEISRNVFKTEDNPNLVRVYINYLREKLDKRFDIRLILTVRGKGYMMKEYNGE